MAKDKLEEKHNCDILICYHNNTKGLCCLYNPDNCKYKQLQKKNAELKADNDARKFAMAMSEKVEKQLREENIKAKNFILKLTTYLEGHTNYDFEYELIKEVKQFLKESEVEK